MGVNNYKSLTDQIIFVDNSKKLSDYLTLGKWYDFVKSGDYYVIFNDCGQKRRYKSEYFLTKQQFRVKNINSILVN